MKENRVVKVYEGSGRNYKRTPLIRLQGDWLKELGFEIGTAVNIRCEKDRLIISKITEEKEPDQN